MNVIGKGALEEFKKKHSDARSQIDSWIAEVEGANWENPLDVKKRYINASIIDGSIVFNIRGNNYRLWVKVSYQNKTVLVKKVGTHNEYIKWVIS